MNRKTRVDISALGKDEGDFDLIGGFYSFHCDGCETRLGWRRLGTDGLEYCDKCINAALKRVKKGAE